MPTSSPSGRSVSRTPTSSPSPARDPRQAPPARHRGRAPDGAGRPSRSRPSGSRRSRARSGSTKVTGPTPSRVNTPSRSGTSPPGRSSSGRPSPWDGWPPISSSRKATTACSSGIISTGTSSASGARGGADLPRLSSSTPLRTWPPMASTDYFFFFLAETRYLPQFSQT